MQPYKKCHLVQEYNLLTTFFKKPIYAWPENCNKYYLLKTQEPTVKMCVRQNSSDLSKKPIPSSNFDLSKKAGSSSDFDSVLTAQPMV